MNSELVNLIIGIMFGLVLGLVVFLIRKDFLQQECDRQLLKEDKKRSVSCVVRMQAVLVDSNLDSKGNKQ